jgi:hypothetical protein
VAATVPARGGGWWVIDTIYSKPMKIESWAQAMRTDFNASHDTKLAVAPGDSYHRPNATYKEHAESSDRDEARLLGDFLQSRGYPRE